MVAQQPSALVAGAQSQGPWPYFPVSLTPGLYSQVAPPPGFYGQPSGAMLWDQQALANNFNTVSLAQPPSHDWYFDSGATNNMTSDAGILSRSSPQFATPSSIVVGNGNLLPVLSTGSTTLPHSLHLNNVLVSPNLIKNLISVRQFTSDNNELSHCTLVAVL